MRKITVWLLCAALALALVPAWAESDLSGYFKTWELDHIVFNGTVMSAADLGLKGELIIFHADGTVETGSEGKMYRNPWSDTGDGLMVNGSADDIYRLQPDGTLITSYQGEKSNGNLIELVFFAVETGVTYTESDLYGRWILETLISGEDTYHGDLNNPTVYMTLYAGNSYSFVANDTTIIGWWDFDGTYLRTIATDGVNSMTFTVTDTGRLRVDDAGGALIFVKEK